MLRVQRRRGLPRQPHRALRRRGLRRRGAPALLRHRRHPGRRRPVALRRVRAAGARGAWCRTLLDARDRRAALPALPAHRRRLQAAVRDARGQPPAARPQGQRRPARLRLGARHLRRVEPAHRLRRQPPHGAPEGACHTARTLPPATSPPCPAPPLQNWQIAIASRDCALPCAVCGRRDAGFAMPCAMPGCETTWHPICGRRGGLRMELAPGGDAGVLRGFCEAHRGVTDEMLDAAAAQPLSSPPLESPSQQQAGAVGSPSRRGSSSRASAAAGSSAAAPPPPAQAFPPPPQAPAVAASGAAGLPPPRLVSESSGLGLSLAQAAPAVGSLPGPPSALLSPPSAIGSLTRQTSAFSDL